MFQIELSSIMRSLFPYSNSSWIKSTLTTLSVIQLWFFFDIPLVVILCSSHTELFSTSQNICCFFIPPCFCTCLGMSFFHMSASLKPNYSSRSSLHHLLAKSLLSTTKSTTTAQALEISWLGGCQQSTFSRSPALKPFKSIFHSPIYLKHKFQHLVLWILFLN